MSRSRAIRRRGAVIACVVLVGGAGCSHSTPANEIQGVTRPSSSGSVSPQPAHASAADTPPLRLTARILSTRLPVPVSDAVVYADGSLLLVAGGLTARDMSVATVTRVDPAGGAVATAGRMTAPVHDGAGLTLGGAHLFLGGGTSASVASVQLLRTPGIATVVGQLPEPRSDLVAAVSGGVGYVLGGYTGTHMLPDVLQTRDGRTFHTMATLPIPVRYAAVAASSGRLWLLGGITGTGATTDVVQRVDLATGTAEVVGHLPRPLSHAAGFVLGTGVYLAGGRSATGRSLNAILRVDPTGVATPAGTLPETLSDAGVAVVGDIAYLVGGLTPTTSAAIVEVRPVA